MKDSRNARPCLYTNDEKKLSTRRRYGLKDDITGVSNLCGNDFSTKLMT